MPNFEAALGIVLKFEGKYVNDPSDRGGETNFGITQTTYNEYRDSIGEPRNPVKEITDIEVSEIYESRYWNACHCDDLSDELAICVFDTAVNTGNSRAIKLLQATLDIDTDGIFGANTSKAIEGADQKSLAFEYLARRMRFYENLAAQNPSQQKFLKGWTNRVNQLKTIIS